MRVLIFTYYLSDNWPRAQPAVGQTETGFPATQPCVHHSFLSDLGRKGRFFDHSHCGDNRNNWFSE